MAGTLQEIHFGIVTNNNDPEKRGRLLAKSQSLAAADIELPDWIESDDPMFASSNGGGSLWLPEVGSTVILIADVHDMGDQVAAERFFGNPIIKWRHAPHTKIQGSLPLPVDLRTNYPNRRGWITPSGHKMIFDEDGSIIVESNSGAKLEMISDGTIKLSSPTEIGDSATELMILGNAFMGLYNAHTHPTGVGPSGTPTVLMTAAQLSQEGNKVK